MSRKALAKLELRCGFGRMNLGLVGPLPAHLKYSHHFLVTSILAPTYSLFNTQLYVHYRHTNVPQGTLWKSSPPNSGSASKSLIAQAFDRVELRGARRRDGAEDDPDNRGHDDGDDRRQARDRYAVVGKEAYRPRDGKPDHDADDASGHRDQNGFCQKLEPD